MRQGNSHQRLQSGKMRMVLDYTKRVRRKLQREGAYNSLMQAFLRFESVRFDKQYGVDTHSIIQLSDLQISDDNVERGRQYQPILVSHLRKILEMIAPTPDDVLVDFGSGKGRVLLIASTYPFRKVIGVEFSDRLCEIAKSNIKKFAGHNRCPIDVICVDAGKYVIQDEETIFYFFNPFDVVVMRKVIENIKTSLVGFPRTIKLVYHNLRPENLEFISNEFELVIDSKLHGISLRVYESNSV